MKFGDKESTGKPIAVDAKTQFYLDNDPNFEFYARMLFDRSLDIHVVGNLENVTEFVPSITEDKPKRR